MTNNIFEQSSGFLIIKNETNILDETSIHTDNYKFAQDIIDKFNIDFNVDNQNLIF